MDLDGLILKGWVCDDCLSALNRAGLQAYLGRREGFEGYPPDDEIDPLIDLFDLLPMCAKCFEELRS